MKKRNARWLSLLLALVLALSVTACGQTGGTEAPEEEPEDSGTPEEPVAEPLRLTREDWADDVRAAVNDFIDAYGKDSPNYAGNAYVVSDFDNTCSIFDVEEQLAVWQLQTMTFALTPEELPDVLATGLADLSEPREGYAMDGESHSYADWIADITAAYTALYEAYGPFAGGLDAEGQAAVQADPQWMEFAAKMRAMYDLVYDNESAAVAYPWVLYWFTGMTEDEIYDLAFGSHSHYRDEPTSEVTWTSPEDVESAVGQVSYTWTSGTAVTPNINELFGAFQDNGIDVWICSASATDPIRAAVDVWGLHDVITGVLAMTNKLNDDGVYVNEYDYENGCAWFADADGGWTRGDVATQAQTQGPGKVTAVNNVLVSRYGCGPLAGFMDSTGDYDFCTVYDSLKLVICYNRASRKVTDGGGVIGETAIYERDTLGYDFAAADAAGDTLYVLQGRDENGLRSLRNSNATLRYGSDEEKLFRDEDNEAQLQYMIEHEMTVKEALDTFAVKTAADDPGNLLGFKYGFSTDYAGYHTVTDAAEPAEEAEEEETEEVTEEPAEAAEEPAEEAEPAEAAA